MNKLTVITGGDGEPVEPDWRLLYTDAEDIETASDQWGEVIREMRERQTLGAANGHAIRRLIEARVIYERSARHVAEHGPVMPSSRKNSIVRNPHWIVMRQSDEIIRSLETELGISPLRRNRAGKVAKRDRKARASDAYLTRAKPENQGNNDR